MNRRLAPALRHAEVLGAASLLLAVSPAQAASIPPAAGPAGQAAPLSAALAGQIGYSAPPPLPAWLPPQPSLGYGILPERQGLPTGLAAIAEARIRVESRPNRGFGELPTTDATGLLGRLRLGLLWSGGDNTALAQFQGAATEGVEPGGKASNRHLDVHQLYYTRSRVLPGTSIRLGRQELSLGNERMVGPANFSPTGRTWDGIRINDSSRGKSLDAFYLHTVNFQTPQAMFYFSGAWGTYSAPWLGEMNLYFLHKGNDKGPALHRNTVGTLWRYNIGGGVTSELQFNGQVGSEAGRDVGATSARAVFAERLPARLRLPQFLHNLTLYQEGEYASGSGATSGDAATFDQLFPTTHGKWGQMDYQGWRNMTELRAGASFEPARQWLAGLDYYNFGLASAHDFWYRSNGAAFFTAAQQNRTKDYGTHTGQEFDASATWKVSPHLSYQAVAAEFFPGDFVKNVTGRSDPSTFLYLQGTYAY